MQGMTLQNILGDGFAAGHRRAAGGIGACPQVTAGMTWQGGLNVPGEHAQESQTERRDAAACCIRDDGLQ